MGTSAELRGRAAAKVIGDLVEGGWTQPHVRAVAHRELTALGSYNKEAAAHFVATHFMESSKEWCAEALPLERVRSFALELSHAAFVHLHAPGMLTTSQLMDLETLPVVPPTHLLNTRRLQHFGYHQTTTSQPNKGWQARRERRKKHRGEDKSEAETVQIISEGESIESRAPLARKRKAANSLHAMF